MHRGKVDPEVSELPRDNELSRDHVNRPLEHKEGIFQNKDVYRRMNFGHMVILRCDFAEA